ncbi:NAD(P)-dependent dehydrogenase (short-subunit alcohol dehydrogenase family) [Lacibacter cauensis]|uniref:NAD(P)-dependent dehydrogenase (Short-subunit alcohol dehydrogenase family) n=1 Tax=Lacibacter cauensis TaxID=510947 RepID=A0A562SYV5_9BACT|nr:SDR family oxidoreductase [Lacibacter cauensis]TWI80117.1 NAD(P)-dependent dehydrogenase (short-subunit alcohol dehydrogenase family) [Lacibacter cauensis]TWI85810.1 NAD(P)-dependent dehydrogenase (short-subunit alcohol dehydrogenase family) [Lacibacter cauensis]
MRKKTVIVTGASTGIGKAISKTFLDKGWNVVMNSATKQNLQNTFEEFSSPENVKVVVGDVSKQAVCDEMVATALQHFGAVDVLINNAGVFAPKGFLDVEEADLDRYFTINLKGTFFATQAAIREMLQLGGGSVLNIGTVLVNHAIGGFPATAPVVSKGAVHALTVQLAAEFGKQNIRVNTIAPGIIRSPLQGKIGVADADSLAGLHLVNRIGEPEDIAEVVYTVATSNFISGEIINVDGGHVAGHHLN